MSQFHVSKLKAGKLEYLGKREGGWAHDHATFFANEETWYKCHEFSNGMNVWHFNTTSGELYFVCEELFPHMYAHNSRPWMGP